MRTERGEGSQLVDGRAEFKPRLSGSSLDNNPWCPINRGGPEGNTQDLVLVKNGGGSTLDG